MENNNIKNNLICYLLIGGIICVTSNKDIKLNFLKNKKKHEIKHEIKHKINHEIKHIVLPGFNSRLGEEVRTNPTWILVNKFLKENCELLRKLAKQINNSTNIVTYFAASDQLEQLAFDSGYRIQITEADGNVSYDSSKGVLNTYFNKVEGLINNNLGTRHYVQSAQLSNDGLGNEIKFSRTTGKIEAYSAKRINDSYGNHQGVIIISKEID